MKTKQERRATFVKAYMGAQVTDASQSDVNRVQELFDAELTTTTEVSVLEQANQKAYIATQVLFNTGANMDMDGIRKTASAMLEKYLKGDTEKATFSLLERLEPPPNTPTTDPCMLIKTTAHTAMVSLTRKGELIGTHEVKGTGGTYPDKYTCMVSVMRAIEPEKAKET